MLGELLGVVALFAAGSWVASLVGRDARLRRAAEKLPVTPMREVADGRRVKVMGTVELRQPPPLLAPISGRGCTGWAVDLQEQGDGWNTVLTEWRAADFVIVDETGHAARVVVAQADLVYELDAATTASWSEPPSERVRAFLGKHGRDVDGPFAGAFRFCEGIIEHGERVTVVGVARRELDPSPRAADGSYREAPTRLVFDAEDGPLWIFDGPARWRAR